LAVNEYQIHQKMEYPKSPIRVKVNTGPFSLFASNTPRWPI
jgi:hypothetical protein